MRRCPTAEGGTQPIPEAIIWLLMTGDFPTNEEIAEFKEEMFVRAKIPDDIENLIKAFPKDLHPMT
jgi:citrate synthase